MRINPKIYHIADDVEPLNRYEYEDGRVVEVFIMDNFEDVYNEFTGQSKFSVWSSEDGQNYRLFVESGNYDVLKDLYGSKVNLIWIDFWDKCEEISNGYSKKLIMPLTLVCVAIYFIGVSVFQWDLWICILLLVTFVGVLSFINKLSKKKIADANYESISKIKSAIGEKHFQNLLEIQRAYPDDFYERKYPSTFDDEEENKEE